MNFIRKEKIRARGPTNAECTMRRCSVKCLLSFTILIQTHFFLLLHFIPIFLSVSSNSYTPSDLVDHLHFTVFTNYTQYESLIFYTRLILAYAFYINKNKVRLTTNIYTNIYIYSFQSPIQLLYKSRKFSQKQRYFRKSKLLKTEEIRKTIMIQ